MTILIEYNDAINMNYWSKGEREGGNDSFSSSLLNLEMWHVQPTIPISLQNIPPNLKS